MEEVKEWGAETENKIGSDRWRGDGGRNRSLTGVVCGH